MSTVDVVVTHLRARELGLKSCIRKKKKKKNVFAFLKKIAEEKAATPDTNKSFAISRKTKSTMVIELSPDGKFVASTHGDHSIRVSEISSGKCIQTLVGHPRSPWTLAFHNTFRDILASGCLGGEVRIWDLKSGECDCWEYPDKKAICSVSFHPCLSLLMVAVWDRVYAWDWTIGKPFLLCTAPKPDKIRWLKFHPTGNWLYTGISNGFAGFDSSNSRQRDSSFSTQRRVRTEGNVDNEDEDIDERLRGIFLLGRQPHPPTREIRVDRSSRRGVFMSGERGESSAEEEEVGDYFIFRSPREQRRLERDPVRWRRPRASILGTLRDEWNRRNRTTAESNSHSSSNRNSTRNNDYLGQVRDIWQQRLGRRSGLFPSSGGPSEGRSRHRLWGEESPERHAEASSALEERVFRRIRESFLQRPFGPVRYESLQNNPEYNRRDPSWPRDGRIEVRRVATRDLDNRRIWSPTDSDPLIDAQVSNANYNDINLNRMLAMEVQEGLSRMIRDDLSENNRFLPIVSSTASNQSNRSRGSSTSSLRGNRRSSELLRSDPILSDYGGIGEPLPFRSQQESDGAGSSELANAGTPREQDFEMEVRMDFDVEEEERPAFENTAASASATSGAQEMEGPSDNLARLGEVDHLQQEVEEHLNNLSDMTMVLRSRISRLREYLDEIDAAAPPAASETSSSESTQQSAPTSGPTVAEGSVDVSVPGESNNAVEASVAGEDREENGQTSSTRVQLGTLDDLFAAALGSSSSSSISGSEEPVASTSGGSNIVEAVRRATENARNRKRRYVEVSSDYSPSSPQYNAELYVEPNENTEVTNGNSSNAAETSTSDTVVNVSSSSADASGSTSNVLNSAVSSSGVGLAQREDNQNQEGPNRPLGSHAVPLAVVFTFNSPSRVPPSPLTPRTASRVAPSQDATVSGPHLTSSMFSINNRRPEDNNSNDDDAADSDERNNPNNSFATDHDYVSVNNSRTSGIRRTEISSRSENSSGIDRSSRISSFMETFFLRRRRDGISNQSSATPRQPPPPPSYDSIFRNGTSVPTPPGNANNTNNNSNNNNNGAASNSNNTSGRNRSTWRFFDNSSLLNNENDSVSDRLAAFRRRVALNSGRRRSRIFQRYNSVSMQMESDGEVEDDDNVDAFRGNNDDDIFANNSRSGFIPLSRSSASQRGRGHLLFDFTSSNYTSDIVSFRIQAWNFHPFEGLNLRNVYENVVVPYASIHNDSSVDVSQDGKILCAFIITEKTVTQRKEVGLFSLESSSLGHCLCLFNLESVAISISISPSSHYLLIGVTAGKYELFVSPKQVVGRVYKLRSTPESRLTAEFVSDITHPCSEWSVNNIDFRFPVGVNCTKWLLGEGEGLIYGTNRGDLIAFSPKLYNPDLRQRRDGDPQNDRLGADPNVPWSWFGAGQMRLADFLIWSAQNNMNIGPVIV